MRPQCRQELCSVSVADTAAASGTEETAAIGPQPLLHRPDAGAGVSGSAGGVLPVPLAQVLAASQRLTAQLYAKPPQAPAVHAAASHLLRCVCEGANSGMYNSVPVCCACSGLGQLFVMYVSPSSVLEMALHYTHLCWPLCWR